MVFCSSLSPVPLRPVDDLLVLPGGSLLPRLLWALRFHRDRSLEEIPCSVTMRRVERPVGASPTTLMRPHWSPSFPRGCPERLLHSEYGKALASGVLPKDVCFHHRWLRFEPCGPHPLTRNSRSGTATAPSLVFPLSRQAAVPFGFRREARRCSETSPTNSSRMHRLVTRA